jgi:hypothetical protein
MASIKVCITKNHIKNGVPMDSENCPIAKAIKSLVKSGVCASVDDTIYLDTEDDSIEITSSKVNSFVKMFDHNTTRSKAKPFEFTIRMKTKDAERYFKKSAIKTSK